MRGSLWLCLIIATLAIAPASAQQDINANVVTVTGEATVSVRPDLASIRAGVMSQGKTAQEASDSNARDMTAVLAAIKDAGIAEKDVQTMRLSLTPLLDPNRAGKQRTIGFQANNQVVVTIRDVGKLAAIIDRLVGAGANDISGIQFIVADPSKALDEARAAAIADAKRKAEIYAQAAGARLGRAVMILADGSGAPGPLMAGKVMAARAPIPVASGEETLRAAVTVSFQLMN